MNNFQSRWINPARSRIGFCSFLGLFVVAFAITLGTAPAPARSSAPPRPSRRPSTGEAPGQKTACIPGRQARRTLFHPKAACHRLPRKIPPASRTKESGAREASGKSGPIRRLVTDEAGDSIEVLTGVPSTPFKSPFNKDCRAVFPYLGASYNPCGYVAFYDAEWETSEKAPSTNVEEDAEYDACGNPVSSGKTEGWHVIGTEYTLFGWHAGFEETIPLTEPQSCLGTWTLIYSFTETFSDGETLTDSVEVPFLVTATPLPPSATWGGGNPSELLCSQTCFGDPVNTSSGDYFETTTDLSFPGRGAGLQMTRTYSSLAAHAGVSSPLGHGWTFNYNMSLSVDPETGVATVTNVNGSQTQFEPRPEEGFVAPPRVLATLVENENGTYTYTVQQRTIYTFNAVGELIGISDLNEDETTLSYDESGQLETATDEAGRSISFSYDESGRLESITDSTGRSVTYGYNEAGGLDEVTNVRGGHERFEYDEGGLLLTREDARGHIVLTNTYDANGRVLTQTDGLENLTKYAYSGSGLITTTTVTDARGFTTVYEYRSGILATRTEAANAASWKAVWVYEHDPITLGITATTDPNGNTTHATYDSRGNQTSTEDALGHTTHSVYDSLDNLIESTDANGITTTYEYDKRGNLLSSSTPLVGSEPLKSRTVTYAYEDKEHPGDVTGITDPDGNTTHFTYDSAGNVLTTTDAAGDETTYTYNERGNRLTEVSPRGNAEGSEPAKYTTTYTYDPAGNMLTETDPLNHEQVLSYDADGNIETETDANGHTTTYAYDVNNKRTSVEQPGGQVEETTYDADGNIESEVNGLEHATTYTYDPLDRMVTTTDPLGRTTEYRHRQAGNLWLILYPEGETKFFGYNAANQITELEYSDGVTPNVEYEYDPDGHRIAMKDGTGESSFEYDSLGRLTSTTDGNGDTTSYGYDLAGNVTSIVYPNGKSVSRTYDTAERLESVTDWLGHTTNFAYDPNSNLTSTTFPEGTGNIDEYAYDHADRMSEIEMKKGPETLASLSYSRDKAGQLDGLASKGLPGPESEAFEYDADNRLTQAGSEGFEYDDANDLTKIPGATNSYDAANQLESGAGLAYRYNKRGERTEAGSPPAKFQSEFGSPGNENGQFAHPAGIALDAEGNVWVVDEENDRVEEFNQAGSYLGSIGSPGSEKGELERPTDVAIDASGNLWVTDAGNNRIEDFNVEGECLLELGSAGSGNGEFSEPESVAIDSHGDIWVGDTYNGRLQEFDKEGEFIKTVGEFGSEEGQIREATGIAVGPDDNVWVADWGNNRVEEFNEEGEFIQQFGTFGSENGQFNDPDVIDVDAEGDVWVGDEFNNRVEEFNEEGEYVAQFGVGGSGEGQFSFHWPMGIAADPEGHIWVSDPENNRVQKWQVLESSVPTTYKYDLAGDLLAVERAEIGESPAIEESYAYDGNGLRTAQTVSGATSYLTWDQSGELPLLLDDGQASYIYGPGELPIEQISSKGTPTYYHHDQLGSTRMLTNSSGEPTGAFSYGAYGMMSAKSGTQTTPLGYTGQYTNSESGLQYLRARVFDPVTGQFLTRDPLMGATASPYAYANGNPLRYVDPSGSCGFGSVGDALESVNPFSEENCAYQAAKAVVDFLGGNAATIAAVTGVAAAVLYFVPPASPLAAALSAVSAATSAYAAGQDAGNGDALQAAFDGLASVLGGSAAAERFLADLNSLAPSLVGKSAADQARALAKEIDKLGDSVLAASILNALCNPSE